jgi:prolyl 4-hydroxylase
VLLIFWITTAALHTHCILFVSDAKVVQTDVDVDLSVGTYPFYGVDVSMPIHHNDVSINYDHFPHNVLPSLYPTPQMFRHMPVQPLGDRRAFYHDFMGKCRAEYGSKCDEYEQYRIAINLQQPRSMINYTVDGFKVIKGSVQFPQVWKLLQEFWDHHKEQWSPEVWPPGNTYVNHWESPTYLVSIDQYQSLRRTTKTEFQSLLWNAAKQALSEWIPQVDEWMECNMYGIRVYTDGAVLNSHLDRLPQVISIVMNIAQETDEAWPLELYSHRDGEAYNVTLQPGDWLLYESHSIIHGRPFPLKGNYYANLFLHLEPKGHSNRHHNHTGAEENAGSSYLHRQYQTALENGSGGHEATDGGTELPPYILPESPTAETYLQIHMESQEREKNFDTTIHDFAANGKLTDLIDFMESNERHLVNSKDKNGWTVSTRRMTSVRYIMDTLTSNAFVFNFDYQPLHEGARGGFVDVVRYLVERGADIHERSHGGTGGNALYYATERFGEHHPVVLYLVGLGALNVAPEDEL